MSNDLDNNSNRHFGAVLLAIAALSMLSVLAAGKIGEARQSPLRAALADVDEWQVSLAPPLTLERVDGRFVR